MTVIERTECVEHGAARMIGGRCHASVSNYVLCLRDGVTVEYVPASQLEGAVEAERARILSLLREWEAKTPGQHEFARDLRPSFYVERLSPGGR